MRLSLLLRSPLALPLAFAVSTATWLASSVTPHARITADQGVVWEYEVAMCARAGDASDCRPVEGVSIPVFADRDTCAAYLQADLARAGNPNRRGSCLRRREA